MNAILNAHTCLPNKPGVSKEKIVRSHFKHSINVDPEFDPFGNVSEVAELGGQESVGLAKELQTKWLGELRW